MTEPKIHYLDEADNPPGVNEAAIAVIKAAWDQPDPSPENVLSSLVIAFINVMAKVKWPLRGMQCNQCLAFLLDQVKQGIEAEKEYQQAGHG
jgi:hypothetical protein